MDVCERLRVRTAQCSPFFIVGTGSAPRKQSCSFGIDFFSRSEPSLRIEIVDRP
jgi:hypothetical protein